MAAWEATAKLVEAGHNWSGHERNVALLNTADGEFSTVSALTGFDFPSDTRGMALVDWDNDGDMDIWMTQRTAPRIRFLRNDNHSGLPAIMLQLRASQSNLHGIGSRVEATTKRGRKLVKTLRAGEGYLSQSSQKLHLGLGQDETIDTLKVRWPDGSIQVHEGSLGGGQVFWEQGHSPTLTSFPTDTPQTFLPQPEVALDTTHSRLIPHSPLPLPPVPYVNQDLELNYLRAQGKRQLIVLWATWCLPCVQELQALNQAQESLKEAGISLLILNLDDMDRPPDQRILQLKRFSRKQGWTLPSGLANPSIMEMVDAARETILGRQWTWSIPASFMLDEQGSLISLYEGSPSIRQLLDDQRDLFVSGLPRDHALPFPGRWYVAPYPPDHMALPELLHTKGHSSLLASYLLTHQPNSQEDREKAAWLAIESAKTIVRDNGALAERLIALSDSLKPNQIEVLRAQAMLAQAQGKWADSRALYQSLRARQPGDMQATLTLAWLLATAPDPDERQAQLAWNMLEEILDPATETNPQRLDVMAAVQAAMGHTTQASEWAKQALLGLPEDQRNSSPIAERLKFYSQGKPYTLPGG